MKLTFLGPPELSEELTSGRKEGKKRRQASPVALVGPQTVTILRGRRLEAPDPVRTCKQHSPCPRQLGTSSWLILVWCWLSALTQVGQTGGLCLPKKGNCHWSVS